MSNFEVYLPLALQIVVAIIIGLVMFFGSSLFGRRTSSPVKEDAYECGITAEGDARGRFPVKFFLVAILFIIFDLETVFLYPWAVSYNKLGLFGLIEMGVFILILLVGYVYIVKKGALKWD